MTAGNDHAALQLDAAVRPLERDSTNRFLELTAPGDRRRYAEGNGVTAREFQLCFATGRSDHTDRVDPCGAGEGRHGLLGGKLAGLGQRSFRLKASVSEKHAGIGFGEMHVTV